MPFQNETCSSVIGQLAGEVEVGLKWQYLHAACDFVGHADILLQYLVESLRQSVVVGYIVPVAGGPLSLHWTRQQFALPGSFGAVRACLVQFPPILQRV